MGLSGEHWWWPWLPSQVIGAMLINKDRRKWEYLEKSDSSKWHKDARKWKGKGSLGEALLWPGGGSTSQTSWSGWLEAAAWPGIWPIRWATWGETGTSQGCVVTSNIRPWNYHLGPRFNAERHWCGWICVPTQISCSVVMPSVGGGVWGGGDWILRAGFSWMV